jgi:two-component system, OmpR family, phosphate regulon sensor histidine kinase PhoR
MKIKTKTKISSRVIGYLAMVCLLLVLVSQASIVYDYFKTTRAGLIRESDAIIEEAFKEDLEIRRNIYNKITKQKRIDIKEIPKKDKITTYNYSKHTEYQNNILGLIDIAINNYISNKVPIQLTRLDSITSAILTSRKIHSKFQITEYDTESGKTIQKSNSNASSTPFFVITSKYVTIDIVNKRALQLTLINPFGIIIKRMSLMLISSLTFAILCMFAFRYLLKVLAHQKQLVAFKNDFLSTIAHELKRPVASLSFNLDCLSMPALANNPVQHDLFIRKSINATTELNETIAMIVALAKVEEGLLVLNKKPVNLKELIEELKNRFVSNQTKTIDIQTVYKTERVTILGDAQLLGQCFSNLLDNAIKYSGIEVLIVITIRNFGLGIVVSVKDNGYGIKEEKLPVIFEKYSRAHSENTKINGFGIGLNYVKTIVEQHKGEVNVNSEPGVGSEFNVWLPL